MLAPQRIQHKVNSGIDVRTAMFRDKNNNIAIAF